MKGKIMAELEGVTVFGSTIPNHRRPFLIEPPSVGMLRWYESIDAATDELTRRGAPSAMVDALIAKFGPDDQTGSSTLPASIQGAAKAPTSTPPASVQPASNQTVAPRVAAIKAGFFAAESAVSARTQSTRTSAA